MAPISLLPQGASGFGKKVHRKRSNNQREPSHNWSLFHHQNMDPNAGDAPMDETEDAEPPLDDQALDLSDAMAPLQEMADRVGHKVEEFAKVLDGFLTDLPTVTNRFDAVYELVGSFKVIAEEAVEELKQKHEVEFREQMKREWSEQARITMASSLRSSSMGARTTEQVEALRQWQREADVWDLFRLMLELHPFAADEAEARAAREEDLGKLGPVHRYSSEMELWQRFLLEDDLARERHVVKMWLERTAEHQQSDIQGVLEVLEAKAGRGKGLWSSGWMDTREKIKAQKLMRNWPVEADSPLPQIRSADNNELLVTTLDPDAPSRQRRHQRTLEKPDVYLERAMWMACWEMLRRGMDWNEVCQWCEDRKEGWRAVAMGRSMDETDPSFTSARWRRACQAASQASNSNEYESAVFGLLGGNAKAAEKACKTVDDHLYAFYSANLLNQFEGYLSRVCPRKSEFGHYARTSAVHNEVETQQAIGELIQRLRQGATKEESAQPMKIIQSYLLADEVGSLIHTVGSAVAGTSTLVKAGNSLFQRDNDDAAQALKLPELEVGLNKQTLRIAAHMSVLYGILRPDELKGDELREDENVVVAYIQYLREAGKLDAIPVYASRLQRERYIGVLSQVLQDITDPREQREHLELLKASGLDVVAIITAQLDHVLEVAMRSEVRGGALPIVEPTEEEKLHPGRRIRVGFLPDEVNKHDEAIVGSLSWFLLMHGGWKVTFDALSLAMRKCLVTGRFTCARMIAAEFPYEKVSLQKSYDAIGKAVNIMEDEESRGRLSGEEVMAWNLMKRQSRTYYELHRLVVAIEGLSAWRVEEDRYVHKVPKPANVPSILKKAKETVRQHMVPVLRGVLMHPVDEDEAQDLALIRKIYIPEVVIAYETCLHAAGNLITRENLLDAMDLANAIAKGKSEHEGVIEFNGIEECFVQAGRVRELMDCFALTSKVMLVLKAEGKAWKASKKGRGRELGLWEIGGVLGGGED